MFIVDKKKLFFFFRFKLELLKYTWVSSLSTPHSNTVTSCLRIRLLIKSIINVNCQTKLKVLFCEVANWRYYNTQA